jgi:ABC-2 type transport system ATP-binding protein
MALIEVEGLRKSYGGREVLKGVSFEVEAGRTVGILGPNGSGKTTCVECIGGLRVRDAGRISVDGMDPGDDDRRLRLELGMQLQDSRMPAKITVAEALELYRAFYPSPRSTAELLERFGLGTQRDTRFEKLSGGQQQRLSVALALVGNPRIAILDELTTGLDPAARLEIWDFLSELRRDGLTVLLVTHFMAEAQHLCDRVVVLRKGHVVADDTPDALSARVGGTQTMTFRPSKPLDMAALVALPGVTDAHGQGDGLSVTGVGDFTAGVISFLALQGATAHHLRIDAPDLDDAYLTLTGDDEPGASPMNPGGEAA